MAERNPTSRLIDTPEGPGRARLHRPHGPPRGTVLLSHGAGGQSDSPDLAALARALPEAGWLTVLIDQPWRVAGKKVAVRPPRLDAAYIPLVAALRSGAGGLPGPVVSAGRSAGARVACRTAAAVAADAVIALSFPLHPPGRPEESRFAELAGALELGLPLLVAQGVKDTFGGPDKLINAGLDPERIVPVRGTHSPNPGDVVTAVRDWLLALALGMPPS